MLRYETLILSNTQITNDELSVLERHFDQLTSESGGKISSFEKWGKYRLAYPVKKNEYGIYILVRFEVPEEKTTNLFKELDSFFKIKFNEIVLRSVTVKLDSNKSLDYKKPEPIDSRTGNLDTFLKQNKMESFLGENKETEKESESEEV